MKNVEIQAVIFDCDGTLVDSETHSLAVLVEHVAEFGLNITHAEAMERFAGNELSVVFREFEQRLGHSLPETFLDEFRHRQMSVLEQNVTAIDGAHELIGSLSLPFCVASNAPLNKINLCLTTTGLIPHFHESRIFSAYQINAWKPRPDLFLMAAEALGIPPENCAVVEDSHFGIDAGLAAGMQVFAFDPHNKFSAFNDITRIASLNELQPVFSAGPAHL